MAIHFRDAGVLTAEALAVIADLWQTMSIGPDTHVSEIKRKNRSTLERLESHGLLREQPSPVHPPLEGWQFPMYDLDMSLKPVKLEELCEQQFNRHPER